MADLSYLIAWDYFEWLFKDRDAFRNDIKASTNLITAFVLLDINLYVWLRRIYIDALVYLNLFCILFYFGFICCSEHLRMNINF